MAKSKHIKLTSGKKTSATITSSQLFTTQKITNATTAFVGSSKPGAPTIGTATATGATTATVAFTQPASNGGATITRYTATSSPGGITGTLSQAGSGTITVSGLTAGTAYTFTVTATNSVGTSAASSASNSITTYSVPGAPTIGAATATGATTATVAFTAPASIGGTGITGYTVTSSPGSITATGSSSPITVSGLTTGTAYTFTVTATNAVGTSSASSASNSITPQAPTYTMYTAGQNYYGGLGINTSGPGTYASSPVQVGYSTWKYINPSDSGMAAVRSDGSLYTWGYNGQGALGLGDKTNRSNPTLVGSDTDWTKEFSHDGNSFFAIKTNGTLWACGNNGLGSLGLGDSGSGTYRSTLTQVGSLTTWASIRSTGGLATLGLKTDGTLWAWGYNDSGQLGLGDYTRRSSPTQVGSLTNWAKISAGSYTIGAIKTDGTLWLWGYNTYGQCARPVTGSQVITSPTQLGSATDWSDISVGGFVLARKTNGTLWTWGCNGYGQLGIGDTTNRSSPVQIGSSTDWALIGFGGNGYFGSGAAIKNNGTLWLWGKNDYGQLGLGDTTNRSSPVQLGALTTWAQVRAGSTTMMLKT